MEKVWAIDAIALNFLMKKLTVPCGFWRDQIFKVT